MKFSCKSFKLPNQKAYGRQSILNSSFVRGDRMSQTGCVESNATTLIDTGVTERDTKRTNVAVSISLAVPFN